MSKKKFSPKHNSNVKHLEQNGVIHREMIGIYNVIDAQTGQLSTYGPEVYGHDDINDNPFRPMNLREYGLRAMWVGHNSGRAKLLATINPRWNGSCCTRLANKYPTNQAAMDLLNQNSTRWLGWRPDHAVIHGDALLITENRARWWIAPKDTTADEVSTIDENLTTPRSVYLSKFVGRSRILLHEKPTDDELLYLKIALYNSRNS